MTISYGSNLGLLENAADGEGHAAALRKLLRGLDALIQCSVKTRGLATPPASPANGDRYLVAASPTGGWSGKAGSIARYSDIADDWEFYTPRAGWAVWVDDEEAVYRFDGATFAIEFRKTPLVVSYADLISNYAPADYENQTIYISDYGNVPVKPTLDGTRWLAQRPFTLASGFESIYITGTTSESVLQETKVPVNILGAKPAVDIVCGFGTPSGGAGTHIPRVRLSNSSGDATGVIIYALTATSLIGGFVSKRVTANSSTEWRVGGSNNSAIEGGNTTAFVIFTNASATSDVFIKTSIQLQDAATESKLHNYHFMAYPGGE